MKNSTSAARRTRAVESFRSAAETIGPVKQGMSLFAVTRGQFSMIDAILHVLAALEPAEVSLWTWTVAEYEIDSFLRLLDEGRITSGRLVIDYGARIKNAALLRRWASKFGAGATRYTVNHAKIATVSGNGLRVLLRGSMNLNMNPRFEQLDVTEGGPDFDLVRKIEDELPILALDAPGADVYAGARVSAAFEQHELGIFRGVKTWKK